MRKASDTLYPDWSPRPQKKWVSKAPARLRALMTNRACFNGRLIEQVERDGIENVAPIVCATGEAPAALKKKMGKAAWKQIHRASLATNANRAYLWMASMGAMGWDDIIAIAPCHLQKLVNLKIKLGIVSLPASAIYAGRVAGPRHFQTVRMLYCDTERMGVEVNPKWSPTRLKREHDAAALKDAIGKTSDAQWATPYQVEVDGLLFTRLVSDRDMSVEGLMQRHCVASYSREASQGRIAAFSISGDERATFAFGMDGRVVDIKGFANSRVSLRVRAAAKAMARDFLELCKEGKSQ